MVHKDVRDIKPLRLLPRQPEGDSPLIEIEVNNLITIVEPALADVHEPRPRPVGLVIF